MLANSLRSVLLPAALAALAVFGTGCYAEVQSDIAAPVATVDYTPMYYDGYVVYYDTVGRPYYYNGGSRYWVPRSYPYYSNYTSHYHTYYRGYNRWYTRHGYGYRTYRQPAHYRSVTHYRRR